MPDMKKIFLCLFLFIFTSNAFARYGFDRMRCKGDLIDEGYSVEKVIELCGHPIGEKNWGNQYETRKWYIYKAESGSATYFLYFEDGYLQESKMQP